MDKKALRKMMIERRDTLSVHLRAKAESAIIESLIKLDVIHEKKFITSFVSFKGEVEMQGINAYILSQNATLLLPRIVKGQPDMTFHQVDDLSTLIRNSYGILEPDPKRHPVIAYDSIDCVLTPGVAFDKKGFRLGYGGGYYDRFFSQITKATPKIGIAYEIQVLDQLPVQAYDMPITQLITETGIRQF